MQATENQDIIPAFSQLIALISERNLLFIQTVELANTNNSSVAFGIEK
jgi:hypothetical protein